MQVVLSQELLTKNLNAEYDRKLTMGQRLADRIADFEGSWQFIGIFAAVLQGFGIPEGRTMRVGGIVT